MAKLHTVELLDAAIDNDIAWRKQELSTALQLIEKSTGPAQRANLRAGVVILYAHWEGWIKTVAQFYVRYVNTKAYPYSDLSTAFLGNALKTRISSIEQASKPVVHNEFAAFIQSDLSSRAGLSEDLVRTESNLSSSVLYDIVDRLGLVQRPEYKSREHLIDHELVNRRNTIAHGEFLDLKPEEYKELRRKVLELLQLFTDDVRNAASMGLHLSVPKAAS